VTDIEQLALPDSVSQDPLPSSDDRIQVLLRPEPVVAAVPGLPTGIGSEPWRVQVAYDLRHACLSTWLSGGVYPAQVAEWAGHSVDVLLRIYV